MYVKMSNNNMFKMDVLTFFHNYRVATLVKRFLTLSWTIIPSLKLIGLNNNMPKLTARAIRCVRTDLKKRKASFFKSWTNQNQGKANLVEMKFTIFRILFSFLFEVVIAIRWTIWYPGILNQWNIFLFHVLFQFRIWTNLLNVYSTNKDDNIHK